jgi:hypothetical protein
MRKYTVASSFSRIDLLSHYFEKKMILQGFSTPFDGDACCTPVECAASLTFAYLQIWAVSTHYHCWSSTGYHPSYNQLALPHSK